MRVIRVMRIIRVIRENASDKECGARCGEKKRRGKRAHHLVRLEAERLSALLEEQVVAHVVVGPVREAAARVRHRRLQRREERVLRRQQDHNTMLKKTKQER